MSNNSGNSLIDELRQYIKDNAVFNFTLPKQSPSITQEEFEFFKEILEGEYGLTFTDVTPIGDSSKKVYDLTGPFLDHVKVTYYNTGTLQYQGNQLYIFENIAYVLQQMGKNELNQVIIEPVSIDEIEVELRSKLPNAYTKINDNLKELLYRPLWHLRLEAQPLDFSHIDFYNFRIVEGQIRTVAAMYNVRPTDPHNQFEEVHNLNFIKFDRSTRSYSIVHAKKDNIPEFAQNHIIELYDKFWTKRCRIMHEAENFDGILTETREEAYENFNQILLLIDRYYDKTNE